MISPIFVPLIEANCPPNSRSGLEYALRLAAATALDVPVSAVLVDALRAPSQGQTEVSRMVGKSNVPIIRSTAFQIRKSNLPFIGYTYCWHRPAA